MRAVDLELVAELPQDDRRRGHRERTAHDDRDRGIEPERPRRGADRRGREQHLQAADAEHLGLHRDHARERELESQREDEEHDPDFGKRGDRDRVRRRGRAHAARGASRPAGSRVWRAGRSGAPGSAPAPSPRAGPGSAKGRCLPSSSPRRRTMLAFSVARAGPACRSHSSTGPFDVPGHPERRARPPENRGRLPHGRRPALDAVLRALREAPPASVVIDLTEPANSTSGPRGCCTVRSRTSGRRHWRRARGPAAGPLRLPGRACRGVRRAAEARAGTGPMRWLVDVGSASRSAAQLVRGARLRRPGARHGRRPAGRVCGGCDCRRSCGTSTRPACRPSRRRRHRLPDQRHLRLHRRAAAAPVRCRDLHGRPRGDRRAARARRAAHGDHGRGPLRQCLRGRARRHEAERRGGRARVDGHEPATSSWCCRACWRS